MSFIQVVGPSLESLALGSVGFEVHVPETCWPRLEGLRMLVVNENVQGLQHLAIPPRLETIFCAAGTVDLLPTPLIDRVLKTERGQKNTITIKMAYTFMEVLQQIPAKGLLQASAYGDWPSVLEQKDTGRIVMLAKTWGAVGVRVEGIDGLTHEETTERVSARR